jgi:integrase/recombinase XerC/integrase/recombinase XerD
MHGGLFAEWLTRYRHHLRMRNYSPKTIRSYDQAIREFGSFVWFVRNAGLDQVDARWRERAKNRLETDVAVAPMVVNDFFATISTYRTLKAKTLNRLMSALSSFYRYLLTQGVVETNPLLTVERPRIKGQEVRYLKHDQVMALIESIDDLRDRLVVRIIYATGVRVSELCGINIEDIDPDEGTVRVRGKGGKFRAVFIDRESLREIGEFIGTRTTGPLFPGHLGENLSPRTVQHIFRNYAPPGITPHKIRHSYASELYRRSKNLRVVQENLGHSSIKTTEIYLHTDLDERRRVYEEFFPLAAGDARPKTVPDMHGDDGPDGPAE